jgi:hypothetical protein
MAAFFVTGWLVAISLTLFNTRLIPTQIYASHKHRYFRLLSTYLAVLAKFGVGYAAKLVIAFSAAFAVRELRQGTYRG